MKKNRSSFQKDLAATQVLERKTSIGWRTTDRDEIVRRVDRALTEPIEIANPNPAEPFYSTFNAVSIASGVTYKVEIRSLVSRENSCTCPDYKINGLGTCKHIEAVLHQLQRKPNLFRKASKNGSPKAEIYLRREGDPVVCINVPKSVHREIKHLAERFFDSSDKLTGAPENAVPAIERAISSLKPSTRCMIRLSFEVKEWVDNRVRIIRRETDRQNFEMDVKAGKRTTNVVAHPLYEFQIDGMLHLTFGERAMLADDMGLGKTVQAIAACALLKELRGIQRVLVVSPASLKTEWEEQIEKFTDLPVETIWGPKHKRQHKYRGTSFFYLSNYEQILRDVYDINEILVPDVIILDEAQRIKNWGTKTAQAVKRLVSPYAFVLTGTPLENRIDEIYSITQFLNPHIFGPLFRFNREFYDLDDSGRPSGYKNLEELRRRIRPIMLRRRRDEVEKELPERIDNNYFVDMTPEQRAPYLEYEQKVAFLLNKAKRRALTKEEHERMQKCLACMRMLCDTTYILDHETKVSPKLEELERILEDVGILNGRKAIIFSEWERMLQLVRDLVDGMGLKYAWHTGSVPQQKRRFEINRFKNDPECKLFLSTDSGGLGLNLQAASVVINLDLPWNPAKLEQRIARAWRKYQKNTVNAINLITSNSIEHRMLATIAAKRELADGIVDGRGDLSAIKMTSGRESFLNRLKLIIGMEVPTGQKQQETETPSEKEIKPQEKLRQDLLAELGTQIHLVQMHSSPEIKGEAALVVVDHSSDKVKEIVHKLYQNAYGKGEQLPVEVLDKQTYESIQRLSRIGMVTLAGESTKEIHRSPALKHSCPSPEENRRKRAGELSSEADKKLRMGHVLAEGGFLCEAIVPVRDAVELAIRALAVFSGNDKAGTCTDPLPVHTIYSQIIPKGLIEEKDVAQISILREMARVSEIEKSSARSMIEAGTTIVKKANTALTVEALG